MRKAMYRTSGECILLKRREAVELFNLSESTIERISRKCGAKIKIEGAARYRKDILQQYIDSLTVNG
jgi:hypothetical protein